MTVELATLADLAVELEVAALETRSIAVVHGLKRAANIIKADAREQIGHYQGQVGAFPAWAPLAESTEEQKARVGAPPDAPLYRFGDLKNSFRSEMVGDHEAIVGSIDPVMEYHEFGTEKMPPRPVLGPALLKNVERIQDAIGEPVAAVVSGQRMGYRFSAEEGGIAGSGFDDSQPIEEAYDPEGGSTG